MSTVTIVCKLPNGIIMQVEGHKDVRINGWNNNDRNKNAIVGADYGMTENVPAALWEAWSKLHAESKLVKGGFIFAAKNEREAKAKATDNKGNKSGHEQLPKIKETNKPGVLGASEDK